MQRSSPLPIVIVVATFTAPLLGLSWAHAACTAGSPNFNLPESTPTADFIDHGDGTVTHRKTGLMWKRCVEPQTWSGGACTGSTLGYTWQAALTHSTNNATLGHTDWRLPNRKELRSIVEYCGSDPAINQTIFPSAVAEDFWTSTNAYNSAASVYFISSSHGGSSPAVSPSAELLVRLVRNGQVPERFDHFSGVKQFSEPSATGSGTVSVTLTGGGTTCGFTYADFAPVGGPNTPPAGFRFHHGLFEFTLNRCTPGGAIALSFNYSKNLPASTVYWNYGPTTGNPTPHWYVVPAVILGNAASFSLTDGGFGDYDLLANGTLISVGGPANKSGTQSGTLLLLLD